VLCVEWLIKLIPVRSHQRRKENLVQLGLRISSDNKILAQAWLPHSTADKEKKY
jgi:hypothetical protein